MVTCPRCAGSGQIPFRPASGLTAAAGSREIACGRCQGAGQVEKLEDGEIPVPADEALSPRRGGLSDYSGYDPGDPVTFPDPAAPHTRVRGTFGEIATDQPIDGRDTAWVRFRDGDRAGTTERVPYYKLRADTGSRASPE